MRVRRGSFRIEEYVRGIVIQARLLFFMISRKQLDSSPTPLSSELFFGNLQIGLQCLGGRLHAPTKEESYGLRFDPTSDFIASQPIRSRHLAQKQIELAGARLAKILNDELK